MANRPIYAYDRRTRQFAMAQGPEAVEVWHLDGPEESAVCQTRETALVALALVDGLLVTIHETGVVVGWSLGDEGWERRWSEDLGMSLRAAASRHIEGGIALVVGDDDGQLQGLKIEGDEAPMVGPAVEGHQGGVEVIAFDDRRPRLASSGRDRAIGLWTLTDGEEGPALDKEGWLEGSGGWPLALSFDRSGKRLLSGAMDNGVYLWRLEEGTKEVRFEHHGWVDDVIWAGDDDTILSASWDDTVGVYGSDPLKPRFQLMIHGDDVVAVMAVPDSDVVAAASYDGTISLWDWRQGELLAVLEGHADWVTDLVWIGDGRFISLSSDRTARIWSLSDQTCLEVLGDPLLEKFELGGVMGLESFGVDEAESSDRGLEDQSLGGPRPEAALGKKVVRRFEDDPLADEGRQDTAVAMLESAVDQAEEVGLEVDDRAEEEDEAEEFSSLLDGLDLDVSLGEESSEGDADDASELLDMEVGEESSESDGSDASELLDMEVGEESSESSVDVDSWDSELEQSEDSREGQDTLGELGGLDEESIDEGLDDIDSFVENAFSEVDFEEASIPEVDPADALGDEESAPRQEANRPKSTTSLGMGASEAADEELSDLEPDSDILDRAFSTRQPPREGSGTSQKDRGDSDDAAEEDSDDESDGGASPWGRDSAGETVTNARPLGADDHEPAGVGLGEESSAATSRENTAESTDDEAWARVPTAQGLRGLDGDGSSSSAEPGAEVEDDDGPGEEFDEPFMPGMDGDPSSTHFGGPAVATESSAAEAISVAQESSAGEADRSEKDASQPEGKKPMAGLIRPSGGAKPASDEPRAEGEDDADSDAPAKPSLRLGERLQELTAARDEASEVEEAQMSEGLGQFKTSSRLTPGEAVTDAELARIPEPRTRESSEDEEGYRCEEVSLEQIWSRAMAMPPMGILNRRIDAGVAYEPAYQVQMDAAMAVIPGVSEHEKRLLTAGVEGEIRLWKIKGDGDIAFNIDDLDAPLINAGFLKGERFFYTLSDNGEVRLCFVPRASQIGEAIPFGRFRIQESMPSAAVVVGDDDHLLVGDQRGTLAFWNLKEGRSLGALRGHSAPITAVAMGTKGPISASIDGQIRFWNDRGMQIDQVDLNAHVVDLAAANGQMIWCEKSGALRIMEEGASKAAKVQGHFGEGRSVDMRGDGYAISGGEDGRLLIYDTATRQLAQEIPIPAPIERVVMRRKVLAAACDGGQTYIFRRVAKKQ